MSKGYRISHGMILNILDIHPDLSDMLQHLPQLNNPYSVRQTAVAEEGGPVTSHSKMNKGKEMEEKQRKHYSIFLSRESALWYCEAVHPDRTKTYTIKEVKMYDRTTKHLVEIVYDI